MDWTGDPDLIPVLRAAIGPQFGIVAVAVVTPDGSQTAIRGADPDADFEIGSISKAVTGMLYCVARDRGLISETTRLKDLLPVDGHGPVGDVTLGSLATHHSGLPNLPPGTHPLRRTWRLYRSGTNPYGDTLPQLLDHVRGVAVGRPAPQYSNLGFQLLGHAVAAAEERPYAALLSRTFGRLWAPATEQELRPTSLTGVSRFGRPRAPWVGEALAPAGGIRADIDAVRDLLTSVLTGQAPGMSALTPVADLAQRVRIGAAWITLDHDGTEVTWHNGGTGGFRSWIGVARGVGAGVAILSATERSVDHLGFRLLSDSAARPPA